MNCITTAIKRQIATAAIRHSWTLLRAAEHHRALSERMEARAHRLAERWGCVDEALAALTEKAAEAYGRTRWTPCGA
jgi:hypothetical protein